MRVRRIRAGWIALGAALLIAAPLIVFNAGTAHGSPVPTPAVQPLPLFQPTTILSTNSVDPAHRFGENHIAVNPTNPNNIVATYNQDGYTFSCVNDATTNSASACVLYKACLAYVPNCLVSFPEPQADFVTGVTNPGPPKSSTCGVFVSEDRGATWKHVSDVLPGSPPDNPSLKDQGDCTVAAAANGNFYIGFDDLNWNDPSNALPSCGIGVDRSIDGGMTWTGAQLSGTGCDGPKVTTDLSDGRIYEASTSPLGSRADGQPGPPATTPTDRYLVSSLDGFTWSTPEPYGGYDNSTKPPTFYSAVGGLGSAVSNMSAANGTLSVVFRSSLAASCNFFVGTTTTPCTVFQYTTDAGVTWHRSPVAAAAAITSNFVLAADPSAPGHYTFAGTNRANQFVALQTHDYGATWSPLGAAVSDPATFSKFHAWLNYSPNGVLGLTWSANQAGGANTSYIAYAAISFDGGATWPHGAQEVSNGASPAPSTVTSFMPASDDYSYITLRDDVAFISWADWRTPNRSGFISAVRFYDYDFGGFLPPVSSGPTGSLHAGRTIPVKFQLSVHGQNVSWAAATLQVDGNPATSTVPQQGNSFRYDPATQQYQFNLSTNNLTPGSDTLTVTLDDGTSHSVTITVS
jgi:VCBS repeat-containing protein